MDHWNIALLFEHTATSLPAVQRNGKAQKPDLLTISEPQKCAQAIILISMRHMQSKTVTTAKLDDNNILPQNIPGALEAETRWWFLVDWRVLFPTYFLMVSMKDNNSGGSAISNVSLSHIIALSMTLHLCFYTPRTSFMDVSYQHVSITAEEEDSSTTKSYCLLTMD